MVLCVWEGSRESLSLMMMELPGEWGGGVVGAAGLVEDTLPGGVREMTLPSESVSDNWLYFVVVVAVGKWEAAFCFPLFHSLFLSVAQLQPAIAAVLRFQSCSNCVGLT